MNNKAMAKEDARIRLARELKKLRMKFGLTQEQVAEKAGVSHRYYQILESNDPTRTATIEILEKLEKVFKKKLLNF